LSAALTLVGVELHRSDLGGLAFGLAMGALGAATLAFVATRNGAALVMCGICLAGLVAGRLAGVGGVTLLAVALGLCAILWLVWISPIDRYVSPTAHLAGGFLAGWAIAETLRARGWGQWIAAAFAAVFALTIAWEIGEYVGDRILDTALIPSRRDSAFDIFFGCIGGGLGIALVHWRAAFGIGR
jgi:hypothetical protein